jgi:hypothetical protein
LFDKFSNIIRFEKQKNFSTRVEAWQYGYNL